LLCLFATRWSISQTSICVDGVDVPIDTLGIAIESCHVNTFGCGKGKKRPTSTRWVVQQS
jgi:hypothetical protein